MEDFLLIRGGITNEVTYEFLWKVLKQIYESAIKDSSSIVGWILPDLTHVTSTDSDDYHDAKTDIDYKKLLMNFWMELFKACEGGSLLLSDECQINIKNKRTAKRRRLGHDRFTSVGFKDLLKGRYKLPAVYLMIYLLKETGIATDWLKLCELARELPSIFKTFAGNDILAGLALVGLADIGTGEPLTGLSAYSLFTTYFSGIE